MNGLIRLPADADIKNISSPLKVMPEQPGLENFSQGFVDILAAIGDREGVDSFAVTVGFDGNPLSRLQSAADEADGALENPVELLAAPNSELRGRESAQQHQMRLLDKPHAANERALSDTDVPDDQGGEHLSRSHLEVGILMRAEPNDRPVPVISKDIPPAFESYAQQMTRLNDGVNQIKVRSFEGAATEKKFVDQNIGAVPSTERKRDAKMSPLAVSALQFSRSVIQSNSSSSAPQTIMALAMPGVPNVAAVAAPMVSTTASVPVPTIPVLNVDTGDQWISRLSQDIGQLTADQSALRFQLKPQHLGKLQVEIAMGAAGDVVRLETETENAKSLILGSQARLEQDIRLSGLKLARVDVALQNPSGSPSGDGEATPRDHQTEWSQHNERRAESHGFGMQIGAPEHASPASSPHHGARYA